MAEIKIVRALEYNSGTFISKMNNFKLLLKEDLE